MNFDKEWEVTATIEIRTSFLCDTKEEAEKEAHEYLSELCQSIYCDSNSYEIEDIYSYDENDDEESEDNE